MPKFLDPLGHLNNCLQHSLKKPAILVSVPYSGEQIAFLIAKYNFAFLKKYGSTYYFELLILAFKADVSTSYDHMCKNAHL